MEKIVITTTSFCKYDKSPLKILEEKGFDVILNPYGRKLKKEESVKLCKDALGIIAGTEIFDNDIMEKLTSLKVISRCGSGLDSIDINGARKRGIKIFNTPEATVCAVSELTVGLMLNLLRNITRMHSSLVRGKWEKEMGGLLCEKKVGIIGFGRIGRKVTSLIKPFGCKIAYRDPHLEDKFMGLRNMPMGGILSWADIIIVHVSGKDRVLGKKELSAMKKGSWLINVSRGGVVDERALYEVLKNGHLSGAAIDVFEKEPYRGPLAGLKNVILTPHIGSYARGARVRMEIEAVKNLLNGLNR